MILQKAKIPLIGFALLLIACKQHVRIEDVPSDVERALRLAGGNRSELEEAIAHFQQQDDSLKLKAAYFLIANMDIHHAADYYWRDRQNKRIDFNEFDYPDFPSAVQAMDRLKAETGGLYKQDTIYQDLQTIRSDYLITNIDEAFSAWRQSYARDIPFKDFCEYILPYRTTIEPLQPWRSEYRKRYQWMSDSLQHKPLKTVLAYAAIDYNHWFTFTYGKETRNEPLPRLGPKHLLFREKGACEDVAALEVFSLRSQGIPVSYDIIPLWATSMGAHFLNTVFDAQMKPIRFDVTTGTVVNHELPREPAKVIRLTYSRQPNTLANIADKENIPPNFLSTTNYVDATEEYWPVNNLRCELFTDTAATVFACLFSGGRWQPMWWGKADSGFVNFTKMPRGTVVLPAFYRKGKLIAAGSPKVNGFNHERLLEPDTIHRRTVTIQEQEHYLIFRPGKRYTLYYWNTEWQSLGERIAPLDSRELVFDHVPRNTLLLLIPEYSESKERPFMIADDGKRYWW